MRGREMHNSEEHVEYFHLIKEIKEYDCVCGTVGAFSLSTMKRKQQQRKQWVSTVNQPIQYEI